MERRATVNNARTHDDGAFSSWKDVKDALRDCRRIASQLLRQEHQQYSWQTTALLDSALFRLFPDGQWDEIPWKDRRHFINACRQAMRSAIIDRHRRGNATKRPQEVPIDRFQEALLSSTEDILTQYELYWSFEQIRLRVAATDSELAEILELRFIFGMSVSEIARVLDKSERHTRRRWAEAVQMLEASLHRDSHSSPE